MELKELGLRFTYHIYKTRLLKYRTLDKYRAQDLSKYPADLKQILFSKDTDEFVKLELQKCQNQGFQAISFWEKSYPKDFVNYSNMPPCLYVQGNLSYSEKSVAIVGSRKASSYGLSIAYNFSKTLASYNISIVSGLAYGIDTKAHQGTIDGAGITYAVLGNSLDHLYPKNNRKIRDEIAHNGALISEFPLNTPPAPYHFPARNRIISALSDAIVVVEAAEKSGALITVDFALEQGKEVYAVPGNITNPLSKGTHQLIKNGAQLIDSIEELLPDKSLLFNQKNNNEQFLNKDPLEIEIIGLLAKKPLSLAEIIDQSSSETSEILKTVTMMEMDHTIQLLGGKYTLCERSLYIP